MIIYNKFLKLGTNKVNKLKYNGKTIYGYKEEPLSGHIYYVNLLNTFDPTPDEGNATPYLLCINTNDSGFISNNGADVDLVDPTEEFDYIISFDIDGNLSNTVEKYEWASGIKKEDTTLLRLGANIELLYNENGYFIYKINNWSNLGNLSGFDSTPGVLWAEDQGLSTKNQIIIE